MIEKKRWLLITFHTADCGLAWRAELSLRPQLEALTQSMDVAGYYELEL